MSFGSVISEARRRRALSQKELASRLKKEDGDAISPQYLNDLERDRRNPPNEHLLAQLAEQLGLEREYLFYVAGTYPDDLKPAGAQPPDPVRVAAAFRAFRRALGK